MLRNSFLFENCCKHIYSKYLKILAFYSLIQRNVSKYIVILEKKMEIIELKHGNSSAQVYAYGATVTSWKQNGKEKLFLSSTGNEISRPKIHGP